MVIVKRKVSVGYSRRYNQSRRRNVFNGKYAPSDAPPRPRA